MNKCLSQQMIRRFLDDALDDDARRDVVEHIESCEKCQQAIEYALENQTEYFRASDATMITAGAAPSSKFSKLSDAVRDGVVDSDAMPRKEVAAGELPELAGFRLVAEVGRGASGVVYEAVQKDLDRRVAIKLISGQLFSQSDMKQRFLREAKSVAALNHPNIAQLFQISENSRYGPYLVFEFVDAEPLDKLIQGDGAMPPKRAVKICRDIAAATRHAHEHHLVHRDLKPSNVLVERGSGLAKVIDFGLAVDPDEQSRLTMDSFIAGTPAYMSPEQIQTPRDVDHRSDIYSLGVVMYELLTGGVPFRGLSKKTLGRVVNEEPQRLTTINPDVPFDLETICLKALNKLPHQRYVTMSEFDDDLHRWQESRPILAKPVTGITRAYRWAQRNPLSATLGAIAALLMLLITTGSILGVMMLSSANQKTRAAKENSDKAAADAIEQRDQLLDTIDSLVYDVNDEVEMQYLDEDQIQVRLLQIALNGLSQTGDGKKSDVTQRIGDINLRLATIHSQKKRYALAEEFLNKALSIADDLIRQDNDSIEPSRLRSFTLWEQANLFALKGQIERALIVSKEAEKTDMQWKLANLSKHDQLNYLVHKGFAKLNLGVGYYNDLDDPVTAISHLKQVYEFSQQMLDQAPVADEGDMGTSEYHSSNLIQYAASHLADSYWELGKKDLAAKYDAQYKTMFDRLAIYDDGRSNGLPLPQSETDENPGLVNERTAELTALQQSKQFYEFLLEDSGVSDDALTLLHNAEHHYRLANLYLETNKFDEALQQFQKSQATAHRIESDEEVSEFDCLLMEADAQLRIIAMAESMGEKTSKLFESLERVIRSLESLESDDELDQRSLLRLQYELSQLKP